MSYELNYIDRGYVVRFKGNVRIEELNEANGEIQGHADFDNHRYQIVDLLEADISSVTEDDAEFPARIDGIASRTRWGVKVALVVRESYALSIVNSYVEYSRQFVPHWEFGVFSNYDEALKWAKA